jgi:hypothetical protein
MAHAQITPITSPVVTITYDNLKGERKGPRPGRFVGYQGRTAVVVELRGSEGDVRHATVRLDNIVSVEV